MKRPKNQYSISNNYFLNKLSGEDICFVRGFHVKGSARKSGFIIGVVLLINLAQFSSTAIRLPESRQI